MKKEEDEKTSPRCFCVLVSRTLVLETNLKTSRDSGREFDFCVSKNYSGNQNLKPKREKRIKQSVNQLHSQPNTIIRIASIIQSYTKTQQLEHRLNHENGKPDTRKNQ